MATTARRPTIGIAHTRWATHGASRRRTPTRTSTRRDRVHVVVNGIVENYIALKRRRAIDMGAVFTSETDAEVIAHLIGASHGERRLHRGRPPRVQRARGPLRLRGDPPRQPEVLVGAREECPLIVGVGEGRRPFASAVPTFLAHTRKVQYIENGELIVIRPDATTIMTPRAALSAR